jgi:hypothetical protein
MRRFSGRVLVAFAMFFYLIIGIEGSHAADNESIRSFVAAINSAEGQARLSMVKGLFRAQRGSNEFRFEVPEEIGSTLKFKFDNGAVVYASWAFEKPIFVEVRAAGKCVRLEVKRFEYEEGGFLSGSSDQTIVPTGPCRESEPLSRLGDFMRLSTESADFFRGHAFVAFDELEQCLNSNCSSTKPGIPIRRADFYNVAAAPGLAVTLRPEATIILPNSGFLVVGSQSAAEIRNLAYDLETDNGDASLQQLKVTLSDGLLVGGDTILRIAQGSELIANEFLIEKQDGFVRIEGGRLSGALGQGTSLVLTKNGDNRSIINIQSAKATLAGIRYEGSSAGASLSILRGQLGVRVESAELWLTDRNSLRMGYTTLDLTLGCSETMADLDCRPVEWTGDSVQVTGVISNFATALTGGQFNVTNMGSVQLLSGQVVADRLDIDTSDAKSPITGKINRFEANLQGQDLAFDEATSARIATASVKANDLVYQKAEVLPVGRVDISGSIERLEGGSLKEVGFVAGASFEFAIERKSGDDPALVDGRIVGDVDIVMSGGNGGHATVKVNDLRYYRGVGDAILELVVNRAAYIFQTPAYRKDEEQFPLKAEINVKSIKLEPQLAEPLRIGPTRMRSFGKNWRIDTVVGTAYGINLPIQRQELVYAPVKDVVLSSTICAPKVMLLQQSQSMTGKIDVFASNEASGIRIYDNAIAPGILSEVDDRGCGVVAKMICAVIGGGFGGPIGAVGLAAVCGGKLEEEQVKLSNTIRDESIKKVAGSDFRFGL